MVFFSSSHVRRACVRSPPPWYVGVFLVSLGGLEVFTPCNWRKQPDCHTSAHWPSERGAYKSLRWVSKELRPAGGSFAKLGSVDGDEVGTTIPN